MQLAADAVVFMTGMPLAVGLIIDGLAAHRAAEIGAGVILAAILGIPGVLLAARARLRHG